MERRDQRFGDVAVIDDDLEVELDGDVIATPNATIDESDNDLDLTDIELDDRVTERRR
jgi:hypothetical protein